MAILTAGVDLGGTKIQTVVIRSRRVVGQSRVSTPHTNPADVVRAIAGTITTALHEAGAPRTELRAIGIGTPGEVDSETGTVAKASNLPGMIGPFPLGPSVSRLVSRVPTRVDNDVRVAVMGEYRRGAGRPYKNLLGVFLGTGVGGGLILEGRLRHGRGGAGEIGHMVVLDNGRACTCGRNGCLEAYAGRQSIENAARELMKKGRKTSLFEIMADRGRDRLTSGVIARALEKGDKVTVELIEQAVWALGIALASAQNLLDVEAVIVGGGLGDRLGEPFIERLKAAMQPHLFDDPPDILGSELGDLSGAVGAAVTVGG
jgi:glucokinase